MAVELYIKKLTTPTTILILQESGTANKGDLSWGTIK